MESKRLIAAALAGAMLFCAGCGGQEETVEEAPSGTAVEVMEVVPGPMSASYSLTGQVAAVSSVQVFPLLAGQVLTLSVEEGDTVRQGQTLFTVDTSTVTSTMGALQESYSATRAATDSAVASAQLGVEQAQLGVEQAQQALDNAEALLEVGAAAEQDVTSARQGLQQAQSALAQAQAGVAQAQAQQSASLAQIQASMDQITTQAELGTVTAPCAGTVTAVNLVRGGMASSAQPAVVIAENGEVEVTASVAEDVFMNLAVGDTAGVTIPVLSDEMVEGTISAQTSLYDVSVSLPSDVEPPIGAFATVTFYTDRRDDTLSVPTEAILTGADDEQYVFVVDTYAEGDTAVRIPVETGLVNSTDTEILSGLSEGDRVVVKGQSYLSDGAAVRIVTGEDDFAADTEGADEDTAAADGEGRIADQGFAG